MALKFSRVAIVHHVYTWTSLVEEELLNYLKEKTSDIIYFSHPFKNARDKLPLNSRVDVYKEGELIKTIKGPKAFGPEVLFFIKDLLFTLFYFYFLQKKLDIYFGFDNLDAFAGIILKRLGIVKKVVYYVIDYVPERFENQLLDSIYHWADFYCVKNADQTWNLSEEMAKARTRDGLSEEYLAKQITVPVGCHPIKASLDNNYKEKRLVFLGNLTKDQGVDLLIECMVDVVDSIPNAKLIIIGSGEEELYLKNKVAKLKLEAFVEFKGFVKDNSEVSRILSESTLGVAPYIVSKSSFKHFTDPGKIKTYLGAGLPIIMTNISHISTVIREKNVGIVINDTKKDITESIIKILSDQNLYTNLHRNVKTLAKEYAWNKIFNEAFISLN